MAHSPVRVVIENLAPENGTNLTPFWVGFHAGDFDTYDAGRPASPGVESIAEDGNAQTLSREFQLSDLGVVGGTVGKGPIAPGETVSEGFALGVDRPDMVYFNYAAMVLPSNDAWIANGDEKAYPLYNRKGEFQGASFIVRGNKVLDAGTEKNDERPKNTAFFGQKTANTGADENGVIKPHKGFRGSTGLPKPTPTLLADDDFANADFTKKNYQLARISVIPEVTGIDEDETLNGTKGLDWIDGAAGNDNINGGGGNDILLGSAGNDSINGGGGKDNIDGGNGDDMLDGGAGMDMLMGGGGSDLLMAGLQRNAKQTFSRTFQLQERQEVPRVANTDATGKVTATLDGMELSIEGTFKDLTSAPVAAHVHFAAKGFAGGVVEALTVKGNPNSGTLTGSVTLTPAQLAAVLSNNYYINLHTEDNPGGELRGQINLNLRKAVNSADKLMGGNGGDVLIGGMGDDMLDGGGGNDTLTGLGGNDTFVIAEDAGSDLILDYRDGRDKIGLAGGLRFGNLTIEQGTSDDATSLESMNNALIKAGGDILASVAFTSADAFNANDFMVV
jgi:Ca2+-binding RTX toxin-like protein